MSWSCPGCWLGPAHVIREALSRTGDMWGWSFPPRHQSLLYAGTCSSWLDRAASYPPCSCCSSSSVPSALASSPDPVHRLRQALRAWLPSLCTRFQCEPCCSSILSARPTLS